MEKKLTLHIAAMYLGCEVESENGRGRLYSVTADGAVTVEFGATGPDFIVTYHNLSSIRPILRPLSELALNDYEVLNGIVAGEVSFYESDAKMTAYLLSRRFDLFGLIDAGEAVVDNKMGGK